MLQELKEKLKKIPKNVKIQKRGIHNHLELMFHLSAHASAIHL